MLCHPWFRHVILPTFLSIMDVRPIGDAFGNLRERGEGKHGVKEHILSRGDYSRAHTFLTTTSNVKAKQAETDEGGTTWQWTDSAQDTSKSFHSKDPHPFRPSFFQGAFRLFMICISYWRFCFLLLSLWLVEMTDSTFDNLTHKWR